MMELIIVGAIALGAVAGMAVVASLYAREASKLATRALSSDKTFSPAKELQADAPVVPHETPFMAFEKEQESLKEMERHLTGED